MNKRIKKKLHKRMGYKHYHTFKCIKYLLEPAYRCMYVPSHMIYDSINCKPINSVVTKKNSN